MQTKLLQSIKNQLTLSWYQTQFSYYTKQFLKIKTYFSSVPSFATQLTHRSFFLFFFSTLNPSTISSKNLMNLVPKLCSTRLVARRAISPNIQIYHWVGGCLRMGIPSGKSRRSRMKRERRPITAEGSEDDILLWVWTRCDRHEAFPIKPRAGLIAQTLSN